MKFWSQYDWSIDPIFNEICSNPEYYPKLYYYGLVSKQTVSKDLEITRNMSNYSTDIKQKYILNNPYEVAGNLLKWYDKNKLLCEF